MDEPLITRVTIDETPRSSPRSSSIFHRQFPTSFSRFRPQDPSIIPEESVSRSSIPWDPYPPSAFLDGTNVNDAVIPTIIATPKSSIANIIANLDKKRRLTQRSNSAPSIFTDEKEEPHEPEDPTPDPKSPPTVVRLAFLGLLIYITIGIGLFVYTNNNFSGHKTLAPVDGLYFLVVTLCTIGYGDIVPDTTLTKLYTCVFILVGFGFIDVLLNGLVSYVLDRQEAVLLGAVDENRFNTMMTAYVIDKEKGRMRIRTKVGLAMGVVVFCLLIGTISAHYIEGITWIDSFYLSVTSVTTVGYGDYNFKTVTGRCFAIVWLLLSTLAVARAFLYLTELRIDKRNRKVAKWVLKKKMTRADLVLADLDKNGSISKSEYVVYKLKEMGKIREKDILQLCKQFDNLENSFGGRLTFAAIEESDSD